MTEFTFNVAEKVLEKLGSLAYGAGDELEKLSRTMRAVKAVLMDAEEQQSNSPELRLWLQQLKDVFYDAEDVLDQFEVENLRRQVVTRRRLWRRMVLRFFSTSNPLIFSTIIGRKVKKINERIDAIVADKAKFQLVERGEERRTRLRERETHSFVQSPHIVIGRDEDKEKIIQLLLQPNDEDSIPVLPIAGNGGMGKTTLAKLVCNDERVVKHFQSSIWVHVSRDFDMRLLVEKIVNSATGGGGYGEDYGKMEMDELQEVLRESLEDKKFLLVLDDLWNENPAKWDELKDFLRAGAGGSMILGTTRSNRVASMVGTMPTYNLPGLPHDECLALFVNYAFQKEQEKQYPNLLKIGEEIVRKCGGVPLAVRTLAGQLFSNTDEQQWVRIKDTELWKTEQKGNDILPALRVSYEQLPSDLKRCFAYCSLFPKNYEFNDYELTQFWMAHGLLRSSNGFSQLEEDIGFGYLKELEYGCFLQDFRDQYGSLQFKMHDVMHDLALSVAQDECSVVTATSQQIDKNVLHLSIPDPNSVHPDLLTLLQGLDRVRTVFIHSAEDVIISSSILETCLSKYKYLRSLNFSRSQFEELPKKIGKLKHLRYLDLSWNHRIKRLPNSICKLQNLQTLLLGGCDEIEELPRGMRYMESLGFLCLATRQPSLPTDEIGCLKSLWFLWISTCENLKFLFEDMENLSALRSLYISTCPSLTSLPPNMMHLTALQDLHISGCENFNFGYQAPCEFRLRKLVLCCLIVVEELPEWLIKGSAETLKSLNLEFCPVLVELPVCLKNFSALQEIWILGCPLLGGKCEPGGDDWYKIAAIPKVIVDNVDIKTAQAS